MYRLGIIEESIDDRSILSGLMPYFVSQRTERVSEDEMVEYGVTEAKVERGYLETIPLHI